MKEWEFNLLCWNDHCNKVYKASDYHFSNKAVKCSCGDYIISPSGEIRLQTIRHREVKANDK